MKREHQISNQVIKRLPRYYRFLGELSAKGIVKISSQHLAELMGITASQIRQDLNCFGGFGQQGYGYNTSALQAEIGKILGLDTIKNVIIIGAGNLGKAILSGMHFNKRGFEAIGIFDSSEKVIGTSVAGLTVQSMDELPGFCKKNNVAVAVLCIPSTTLRETCETIIDLGIKGIWNFSHGDLSDFKDKAVIENVHLGDSLAALGYNLK